MTRINAGIPPAELSDKHLLAEHREIKRIPNHLAKHYLRLLPLNKGLIPTTFSLGKGHVLFFIDKGKYTRNRYGEIYDECLKRNFKITFYGDAWSVYEILSRRFKGINKNWTPTPEAIELIRQRIKERNNGIK